MPRAEPAEPERGKAVPAAGTGHGRPEQKTAATAKKAKGKQQPAERAPIARVAVDTPLPHLDRLFDYRVPEEMAESAVPGCRVKVPFHGRSLSGFLIERCDTTDYDGRLAFLSKVVSPEPVLTTEIADLARAVADRYAGTLSDVLRLAVPPRHARVEKERAKQPETAAPESRAEPEHPVGIPDSDESGHAVENAPAIDGPDPEGDTAAGDDVGSADSDSDGVPVPVPMPEPGPWTAYRSGPAYLGALYGGSAPRAVWTALPGSDWADAVAVAAGTAAASGRGTIVVVPDGRDVGVVDAAMERLLGSAHHVALTAELGPAERYRRWLTALRGEASIVVGTRAAMFAPVRSLGLVVLWDDGDDVHTDPHAPYPNARTVLTLRAHKANAGALIGGHTRTAEGVRLIGSGWAAPLAGDRGTVRGRAPRVQASGDDRELARDEAARSARIPSLAMRVAREAAATGPVLVQVPRRGYLSSLACGGCRAPARCDACQGPLAMRSSHAMPYCRWCGRIAGDWACDECGHRRMRAAVVGDRRTAEELGRAFPSLTVRTSGRDDVLTSVPDRPALVVATPGAEPTAVGGYAAALLLDGWALLGRADLRASEEAVRRWFTAAALVRPADQGGRVIVMADAAEPEVQALVRWDPAGFAEREFEQRRELGFPPAVTMASVTGAPAHVRELLDGLTLPESAELLGPVPVDAPDSRDARGRSASATVERALLRVPHSDAYALTSALKSAAAARSARRDDHLAQVRVDPLHVV